MRKFPFFVRCSLALFFSLIGAVARGNELGISSPPPTKLLRFPAIHGESLVFCHGGDIWKAPTRGGVATRLTAHAGQEAFPKFSPDGKWIAFTGQYDGDDQVYVIPVEGGAPRQLTFYPSTPVSNLSGFDNIVYGWTPDGRHILFRSLRDSNGVTELGTLFTVPLEGGLPQKVGVPSAGVGTFSPDGSKLLYSPHFRDFRAWKRYQGGLAQYLVIFDRKTKDTKRLDEHPRTERDPVWLGDKIYFCSDRTGTLNLFQYDTGSEEISQITHEEQWDVRWASGDGVSRIVFERAGELVIHDTQARQPQARFTTVKIYVPHDGLAMRSANVDVSADIEGFAPAPGGKRVAVTARGDLFTVSTGEGFPRNLTLSSNAHEREVVWSYNGKTLAFISDKSGEDQIYLQDAKAEKPAVQLSSVFKAQLNNLAFSPCGHFLSVNDSHARLWVVSRHDIGRFKRGVPVEVAVARHGGLPIASWSPCGNYLAYALPNDAGFSQLHIHELSARKTRVVTSPMFDVQNPAWDPAGNFLYFLSRREFSPQRSSIEWNFAGNRDIGIYALALRKDVLNPFGPRFDDDTSPLKADGAKADAKKTPPKPVVVAGKPAAKGKASRRPAVIMRKPTKIDWNRLGSRVVQVPVPCDNYSQLAVSDKALFYIQSPASFYGRDAGDASQLMHFDLKERKTAILARTSSYTIAPDFSHIIYRSGNALFSTEPKPSGKKSIVKTDKLSAESIPTQEWAEMYEQAWRKFRDFFYVRNMHGLDWVALGEQYRQFVPHIAHRSDLNYLIADLIGELNAGHTYVTGGKFVRPTRPRVGLPGCRFELDAASGLYRISKIYRGENEEPRYRSPLTELGVNARTGDYVLAVDGVALTGQDNPYRLLRHKSDPVTLTLNAKPTLQGARKVTYLPVDSERALRYLDFVSTARERVAKATQGRVGYLHIPDMSSAGAYEFLKWYYPQIRKEGLVVDVRSNGGGNISQWIIMRLNQPLLGTRFGGPNETPGAYPSLARHGHQVCLINETAGSDGDIFPWNFRKAGLGPLIGKRTWGGVVGISPVGSLLDGGKVSVPLRGTNDEHGEWIIEGWGVEPDIEVSNDPKSVAAGRDNQLERGIAEVLKRMEKDPRPWPKRPEDPVKTEGK
ncbi:MAG: PDZ domain-containing protein [Puniceicoccales bacterium]|jgi:tricorn protease|nr:PDZ domain-containing protein [Puniceicoccales bacterium]